MSPLVLLALLAATPPAQPRTGVGGSAYLHGAVAVQSWGAGAQQYWLFTPGQPRPASVPVVGFLHGWGGAEPAAYQGWIEHLVRRGAAVVFPRYQAGLLDRPAGMTAVAAGALRAALDRLGGSGLPRFDGRLTLVGHSLGGTIAANLAAAVELHRLPPVRALTVVQPGDSRKEQGPGRALATILGDYAGIPAGTLMQVVVGADDTNVGAEVGRRIFLGATRVSTADKDFIVIHSDARGTPPLVADHFAPLAPAQRTGARVAASGAGGRPRREIWRERRRASEAEAGPRSPLRGLAARRGDTDALDYFGFWRLADALISAALEGRDREIALGGGAAAQTFMGTWSDGTPVRPLEVTDTP